MREGHRDEHGRTFGATTRTNDDGELAERGALAIAEEVMRLTNATADTSSAPIVDEQGIVVALARGWMAAAGGDNNKAHRLALDVLETLRKEPAFTRTDAKFAGLALWRLFDRLGEEERAFAALRWADAR